MKITIEFYDNIATLFNFVVNTTYYSYVFALIFWCMVVGLD